MKRSILLSLIALLAGIFTANAQFPISIKQVLPTTKTGLSEKDAADGIREALVRGTGESVKIVSKLDGYLGNPEIRIPFPPEAKEIENKLRSVGMGTQVDNVVTSINRAAEDAAKSAADVFIASIRGMSISDALGIVRGGDHAATGYLEKTTTAELTAKFTPIVKASLDRVDATRLWGDVIRQYNQIPFVKKQNPDLTAYVTGKAIAGLFVMVAKEEAKIRKDPAAQVTDLLRKVFGK